MNRVVMIDGRPGNTARYIASDVAQSMPAAVLTSGGAEAVGLLITCEWYPIRFTLGAVSPTQGLSAIGHVLNVGDVYRVYGNNLVSTFKYINANNAQNGILQITPYYT